MILFLHSFVHITLISWALSLHQSIFPSSISLIICSLVDFGGSPYSGDTNDFLSIFFSRSYFGAPLSICAISIRFWVINFGFPVSGYGYKVTFYLGFFLA